MRGDDCFFQHVDHSKTNVPRDEKSTILEGSGQATTAPICRFFATGECRNGNSCRFRHESAPNQGGNPDNARNLLNELPYSGTLDVGGLLSPSPRIPTFQGSPAVKPPASAKHNPMAEIPCKFYAEKACKSGKDCRFRHELPGKQPVEQHATDHSLVPRLETSLQGLTLSKPSPSQSTISRDIGGARVEFGDGAAVLNVKPAAASDAQIELCDVTCSWDRPTRVVTLEYDTKAVMTDAVDHLKDARFFGNQPRLEHYDHMPYWIQLFDLPSIVSHPMIKGACGRFQPRKIRFDPPTYTSSDKEIGEAVQRLLSSRAPIEAWRLISDKNKRCKADATFKTRKQALDAVAEFNNYSMPQLGGSQVALSCHVEVKFVIPVVAYKRVLGDLRNLQQRLKAEKNIDLKIRSDVDGDRCRRLTVFEMPFTSQKRIVEIKSSIEKILDGHTAKSGKGVIWHELFLKPEGLSYLTKIGQEHDVVAYRNAKNRVLTLYGRDEAVALVESLLAKTMDDLSTKTFNIALDNGMPLGVHQAGFRAIVARLGKTVARLNITTVPKTVTIHGTSQDAQQAEDILRKESDNAIDPLLTVDQSVTCAVCWCEATNEYRAGCGHVYDWDCFVRQCLSSDEKDIPIKCLGDSGGCQKTIALAELEEGLTRDQLDQLLERSFASYIRTHPNRFKYCPTADCDQIYAITDEEATFTCSACLSMICSSCGAASHDGMKCAEYKKLTLGDEAFLEWKKSNDARDCPKCGSTIQKTGGCNHMQCRHCNTHICWVCMETPGGVDATYDHLTDKHGSIFRDADHERVAVDEGIDEDQIFD